MAASEYLNKDLFHGTSAPIGVNDILEPNAPEDEGGAAYASPDIETARAYAKRHALRHGRLFGTVYRVKPLSAEPQVNDYSKYGGFVEVADPKGMQILDIVDYPLNPRAKAE